MGDEEKNISESAAPAPASANKKKKLQKSYFDVLGLCCSSEIPLVENILKQLHGVKDVSVIVASRTVIVVHDNHLVSATQIVNALNQARLEANIKVSGESNHQYRHRWPSPYAIASGTLLLLSFLKYVYHPLRWFAIAAVVAGIFPVAWKGLAAARNFRIDINILVIVAVVGTIAVNDYLEAGTIVFLFTIAEWLESRAGHKATAEMSSLMSMAPQKAVIAETGEVVDVDEVNLNTVVAVKAGEVIPIDGIVVDGRSEVDEKTLTGESFPASKQKDSTVWAGTINLNGYISVRTTALAEECVVAKMAKHVEEAQNKKSRTQRFIDKCAKFYTPAILVAAVGLAVVPLSLGVHNKDHWFHLALVVLVSSCPCALVLSTPVATFCALTKAAKSGVLIKGGDYLETLAMTRTVAFDKTGTITKGEFVVVDFQSLSGDIISLETLLYWVTSVESKSSHPLAAPVVQYGRSFGIESKPEDVEDFQNFPGEGIYGNIDGKDIFIGNKRIAAKAGCEIAPSFEEGGVNFKGGGKTVGYVFVGATLVGIFSLSDECRTGVAEAITKLKSMKIKTALLTGDTQEAAMHAQNQINHALDLVHAELLPEDKSKIIEALKRDGPIVMVGDGINDAPALATADIGISMGISGSALAVETGHVILMSNDVRKIPNVICLARRARRTVIVNVVLSIATKAAILALAFAGHPLIWAAVLADVGTCIVVILNSMLLLHERQRYDAHGHGHKHGSQKCCSVPKRDKCCSKDDVLPGQNHKKHESHKKCCKSSSVPDDDDKHGHCDKGNHRHHHPESQQLSCESRNCTSSSNGQCSRRNCATKEHCAAPPKKASCESRNCTSSSTGQCSQIICHSSQSGFSFCESKEFPNSSRKQECCSSIDDGKQYEAGGSSHLIDICNNNNIHGCSVGDSCSEGISSNQGENHGGVLGENSQKNFVHAACCSLEKKEIEGCCKSYMRECCGHHHGHLRHGLGVGGSLTEIITE